MSQSMPSGASHVGEVRVTKVSLNGADGLFFGTRLELGWQATDGTRRVTIPCGNVKRADWSDGVLTVGHCDLDEDDKESQTADDMEIFEVEGILPAYVNQMRMYFESSCNKFLHRSSAVATAQEFDLAIKVVEDAAYRVNKTSPGSVARMAKELDLMDRLEDVCKRLKQLTSGDKQVLSDIFAANECERIGRLKLILEKCDVQLCGHDSRWLQLDTSSAIVQNVLKESGTYRVWTAADAQDIWLRRAETVVGDDSASAAGCKDDDDDSSDDEDLAAAEAEATAAKEAEAYVPIEELVEKLMEEPAPEEETINISVDGQEFSFPLKLAKSLDYWDMFEAVSQRVKARKILKAGSEIFELMRGKTALNEDAWDALRRGPLGPGDTLTAKTRGSAAEVESDEAAPQSRCQCYVMSGLTAVFAAVAAVCLATHFVGGGSRVAIPSLNPNIQFDAQRFAPLGLDFRQTVEQWMVGADSETSLRSAAESAISYKVVNPTSESLSVEQLQKLVNQWEEARRLDRVDEVVIVCKKMREYMADEAGALAASAPNPTKAIDPIKHLLRQTTLHYAVRGGEVEPTAPGILKFPPLDSESTEGLREAFVDVARDFESSEAPAKVFEQAVAARAEVARALATIFLHPVGSEICKTSALDSDKCSSLTLLAYVLHASSNTYSKGLLDRVAKTLSRHDIEIDYTYLSTASAQASAPLWLVACVASVALVLAARSRNQRGKSRVASRQHRTACITAGLQMAAASGSPLLSQEP